LCAPSLAPVETFFKSRAPGSTRDGSQRYRELCDAVTCDDGGLLALRTAAERAALITRLVDAAVAEDRAANHVAEQGNSRHRAAWHS
jgi:hypothetical protein